MGRRHARLMTSLVCNLIAHPRVPSLHTGMPDVDRLSRRLEAKRLGLPELCQLYRASAALPMVVEALQCYQGPHANMLQKR